MDHGSVSRALEEACAAGGLRPYQEQAVEAVTAGLCEHELGQLLMACGTGKTRVAASIAAVMAPGGVTVMLVPGLALAAQVIRDWQAGCPVDRVLAVCSDPTVGTGLPVPVTTDPAEVGAWLRRGAGRALVVGTYDSARRLAQGLRLGGVTAELAVCDEAHRLAGDAGKLWSQVLRPGFLPARRMLFMTATPVVVTGTAAGGELATASMDDEAVFGPVLFEYGFAQAIAEGWLKDYRIVIATVSSAQVSAVLDASPDLAGKGDVPVRMAAAQAALAMAAAEFGLRRCVAFVPRIAQARMFAATLPATLAMLPGDRRPAGPVSAGHVHGEMTSLQRDLALQRLRRPPDGGWAVVANARCLTEGVDVPAVDSVLFGTPKESAVDVIQAVGRALRPHDDADTATIVIPALLPDAGPDGTVPGDGGRWDTVLRVVRAVCAHDQSLGDELSRLRARRAAEGDGGGAELPARVTVLAPPGILSATLDALRLHVVQGTTSSWHDGYGHARAYWEQHGDLDVPTRYVTASGFGLGGWLSRQRTRHSRSLLDPGRALLLDGLGIEWEPSEAAWMCSYRELAAFAGKHGHFEVPPGLVTASGIKLSLWAGAQRTAAGEGRLTDRRARLLEKIGFPLDQQEARWMRRYRQLAETLTRPGAPARPRWDSPEGQWLQAQYSAYRDGRLSDGRLALLRQAGIEIPRPGRQERLDARWAEGYAVLAAYWKEHGHLQMPEGYETPDGFPLYGFQKRQRERRKDGYLTPGQAGLLDKLGFSSDPATDAWNAHYQGLRDWLEEHGRARLPPMRLRSWLRRQRADHNEGSLPADRAALLSELGALSDPGSAQPPPGHDSATLEIVRLREEDGLGWKEIAARTGLNAPAARARYSRWTAAQDPAAGAPAPQATAGEPPASAGRAPSSRAHGRSPGNPARANSG